MPPGANVGLGVRVFANVTELKAALADGRVEVSTTTAAMEKLSKSLTGDKLIQNANNITAAVMNIGGASKLTEAEQARVNATLDKAIQKYDALGKEAPAAMLALHQATEKLPAPLQKTDESLGKIWSGLKGAVGLIGVTFTAGAVVGFTGKVFDAASAIHDQAIALDYSAEAFQRNAYAAKQSGSSQESFTKAAGILNEKIGSGDKSTVAALAVVNKHLDDMRAMKPEDTWLTLTNAVAGIEDPYLRAQVGQDLFGKGFKELLPGMIEGYDKLGASATVMSNKTIERLEAAQDKWDAFWNSIVIHSGEVLGAIAGSTSFADQVANAIEEVSKRSGKAYDQVADSVHHMSRAQQEAFVAESEGFTASKKHIEEVMTSTSNAIPVIKEKSEADKKAAAEAAKHAEALQAMADVYTGKALAAKVSEMNAALAIAEKQGGLTAAQTKTLGKELDGLKQQGADLTPRLQDVWRNYQIGEFNARAFSAQTITLTKSLRDQTSVTLAAVPTLASYNAEFSKMITTAQAGGGPASIGALTKLGTAVKELPPPPTSLWQTFATEGAIALSTIGTSLEGLKRYASDFAMNFVATTLDILVPGLGQIVQAAWPLIEKGLQKIWEGIKSFFGKVKGFLSGALNFFGSAPRDSQQDESQTPGYGYAGNPNDPWFDPGNPTNPTAGDGGMNTGPTGGLDPGYSGYALGTGGRYVNFGRATRTTLHNEEGVVRRSDAPTIGADIARAMGGTMSSGRAMLDAMADMVAENQRALRQIATEFRMQMMAVQR